MGLLISPQALEAPILPSCTKHICPLASQPECEPAPSLPHAGSITSQLRTARPSLPLCGQQRGWISPARMSGLTCWLGSRICRSPSPSRARQPALKRRSQRGVTANPQARRLLAPSPYIDPSDRIPGQVRGTGAGEQDGIAGKRWGQEPAQPGLSDG